MCGAPIRCTFKTSLHTRKDPKMTVEAMTDAERVKSRAGGDPPKEGVAPEPIGEIPVKFTPEQAACLLAWQRLWMRMPTMDQLALYRRDNGAYFCAVEGCGKEGLPEHRRDTMVTIGPLCFCHEHGNEVLRILRNDLQTDADTQECHGKKCQWHYLSKTLYVSEASDIRKAQEAQEGGEENRGAAKATEEMDTRADRLEEAVSWGRNRMAGLKEEREKAQREAQAARLETAERLRAQREAQAAEAARRVREAREAQEDERRAESLLGAGNPFLNKTVQELDAAAVNVAEVLAQIRQCVTDEVMDEEEAGKREKRLKFVERQIAAARERLKEDERKRRRAEVDSREDALWASLGCPRVERAAPRRVGTIVADPAAVSVEAERGGETGRSVKEAPVNGKKPGLQVPCSGRSGDLGDPHERAKKVQLVDLDRLITFEAASSEFGDQSSDYRNLVIMCTIGDSSKADPRSMSSQSRAYKAAKKEARACLLHGPEVRARALNLKELIDHITRRWPDQWQKRANGSQVVENDPPKFKCSECPAKVRKLFGDPPTLCGQCWGRHKNQQCRGRSDANKAKRHAAYLELRKNVRPNQGSGLLGYHPGKKGGGKDKGKGGKGRR